MKLFIKNLLGLSLLFLIVLVAFEFIMLLVPNRYSYKYKYVKEHLDDIEFLFLGNCHIEDAVNPKYIGKGAFNTAISGREIIYDVELAKRFVSQMQNLKAVLIQLDYRDFGFGREQANPRDYKIHGGHESTFKCMYTKYMDMRVDGMWYWSEILNSDLNYKYRIWLSKEDQIECDSLGFVCLKETNKNKVWEYWDLPRIYDVSKEISKGKYDTLYNQYATIAQLTCTKGVKLILLSTPMYRTYLEDMVPKVREEMRTFVGKLEHKYPNVEYYDFMDDTRFLPIDFYDASHLSESGSKKFSLIIKDILL